MATASHDADTYYVPHHSKWPFVGSIALFVLMLGVIVWFNGSDAGFWVFLGGLALITYTLFGWFGDVVRESESGLYNKQVDASFRQGMVWFIFSEVMLFAVFFGALFYIRAVTLPMISGEGIGALGNQFLWDGYLAGWPENGPAQIGGVFQTIPGFGLPLINTLILLTSGLTLTVAHHAMVVGNRPKVLGWLAATIGLGLVFFAIQAYEYYYAWNHLNLTLATGIYGALFYALTGLHGLHVLMGVLMLTVIWFRVRAGHFTPERHFGFEAAAWYWHFVDVVWLVLFVFVYVL